MTSLFNDYRENEYVNNTYLPGTYMFMKKIFLVTNFINETFLGSIENSKLLPQIEIKIKWALTVLMLSNT